MEKETMDKPKELREIVNEKLDDAQTPGANVEFGVVVKHRENEPYYKNCQISASG